MVMHICVDNPPQWATNFSIAIYLWWGVDPKIQDRTDIFETINCRPK
jgi:hypothetical protein